MSLIFNDLDAVYCLCIEKRKKFVLDQANKLKINDKLRLYDAFEYNGTEFHDAVNQHLVYPVLIKNQTIITQTLRLRDIFMDIIANKFNYALIIEDDVIFLENMFQFTNEWINKTNISQTFNINKPYVLHLISIANDARYPRGIMSVWVKYGQPAYIINHHACQHFLRHLFPIILPIDEYMYIVKIKYKMQCGILSPYVCRELSTNIFKYHDKNIDMRQFDRTSKNVENSLFVEITRSTFYFMVDAEMTNIYRLLFQAMCPCISVKLNETAPNGVMCYYCGGFFKDINNCYLIGTSVAKNIIITEPAYLLTVRGKRSKNFISKIYANKILIGDILLLIKEYVPIEIKPIYDYCFILHHNKFPVKCESKYIAPAVDNALELLTAICQSNCVVSDDINYIVIADSYGIESHFVLIDNISTIDAAQDYYSNFPYTGFFAKFAVENGIINITPDKIQEIKIDNRYVANQISIMRKNVKKTFPLLLANHPLRIPESVQTYR